MKTERTSASRRTALSLGLLSGAGLLSGIKAYAAGSSGGIKVTVLYGKPKDIDAFEKYYIEMHTPLVNKVQGITKQEYGKGVPGPDGKEPPFYRISELYFSSVDTLKQAAGTPEWAKVVADVPNFASGGVTILLSQLV